jgi:KDO2-lipid IV(A) lauroyltransferase
MRLLLGLMWLLHWLPLPWLARLGEAIGTLLFAVLRSRRRITLTNLQLCLPRLSDKQRRKIARDHFRAYARSVLERGILWWASEARLRRLIRIEPGVPLDQIAAGPTILLCPHFVGLDVAGVAVMFESSLCSIYTRQRSAVFDAALLRGRSRFRPIKIVPRVEGVKPIIRAMRDGLPFFMLPDMDFGEKESEFVPFCADRRGHWRESDTGDRHLSAELRGLDSALLSGLGKLSRQGSERRHARDECLHRKARAGSAGRVFLEP